MPYARPDIYVQESLPNNAVTVAPGTSVAAFLVTTPRGPEVPTAVSSWNEFTKLYGGFGYGDDSAAIQVFFAFLNGARIVWISREKGSSAAAATRTLTSGSGPTNTLVLTASNFGAWGNRLYAEVALNVQDATRFDLLLHNVAPGDVSGATNVVEQYQSLSLNPADPLGRYVLDVLNSVSTGSTVVVAALAGGYTYASGDVLNASTSSGGDQLTGGANGSAPTTTQFTNALYALDAIAQPFVLNAPGIVDATKVNKLIAYADPSLTRDDGLPGRGDVFIVLDSGPGLTASQQITAVGVGAGSVYTPSSYAAVYYPQLVVSDPTSTRGATKLVPSGGAVVGQYMATDSARGFFKAPAGIQTALKGVLALDPAATLRAPDLDQLNLANINAIKPVVQAAGNPICIYGARTLRSGRVDQYINARRTIISTRSALISALQFAVFENNDPILWGHMHDTADAILRALWQAGGLKGQTQQAAYYIICDSTNNTDSTIEQGLTQIEVGLALETPAEFISLLISQYDGGATVTDSLAA